MKKEIIPVAQIAQWIHVLRGQKVMLDFDLAALYGVATKVLNQAVRRNHERFPRDFMFRLTLEEMSSLRSQIVTSSLHAKELVTGSKHGGTRYQPYAFTEQGVAMLSSVLKSERAVKVNIAIMRAFVESGERTRLACWRWRPRHRELALNRRTSDFGSLITRRFSASRRKEHAGRVRSPIR